MLREEEEEEEEKTFLCFQPVVVVFHDPNLLLFLFLLSLNEILWGTVRVQWGTMGVQ